jgi:hypothetical protein
MAKRCRNASSAVSALGTPLLLGLSFPVVDVATTQKSSHTDRQEQLEIDH